ncbi:MAG: hypothetical protein ABIY51_10580 [Ferruginibacter sp.]
MKKTLFLFISCITCLNITAQCVTGNCENGKGKFDFGWCTYDGTFKNGKPDGEGTMLYDDYTYVGHFTNGIEDGKGVITYKKDGRKEEVAYISGKKVQALQKVNNGEWKELDIQNVNCKTGNCNTGFGTYIFPSGNKYTGNFVNNKFEGNGTFYFNNGDRFEGTFHNNEKYNGLYTYSNGAKYQGTYDSSGMEYNGTITSLNGMTIPFVNGKVIIPVQIKNTDKTTAANQSNKQTEKSPSKICPFCNGAGKTRSASYYGNASNSDKAKGIYQGDYHSGETTICAFCKGKGVYQGFFNKN